MHTHQEFKIDSPFKQLSEQLDGPTELEARVWAGLFWTEKRALGRMAHMQDLSNCDWLDMTSKERIPLRIAIDQIKKIAVVFGGPHA
jgi:hypothetical protein